MNRWEDSAEYAAALHAALAPMRGTAQYAPHLESWTDLDRFAQKIQRVRRHKELVGAQVLDSGCGTAGLAIALLSEGARAVTGVEANETMLELARIRTRQEPRIRILSVTEARDLPDSAFDAAFSVHVIEHTQDPAEYLMEMARVLRPGGVLYLGCPSRLWPFEAHGGFPLLHYLPGNARRRISSLLESSALLPVRVRDGARAVGDVLHFSGFTVRRMVEQAGLQVLEHNEVPDLLARLEEREWRAVSALAKRVPPRAVELLSRTLLPNTNIVARKP